MNISLIVLSLLSMAACEQKIDTGWSIDQVKDDPVVEPVKVKAQAPLYWTVYEFCYEAEHAGTSTNMPKSTWEANIKWVWRLTLHSRIIPPLRIPHCVHG